MKLAADNGAKFCTPQVTCRLVECMQNSRRKNVRMCRTALSFVTIQHNTNDNL